MFAIRGCSNGISLFIAVKYLGYRKIGLIKLQNKMLVCIAMICYQLE